MSNKQLRANVTLASLEELNSLKERLAAAHGTEHTFSNLIRLALGLPALGKGPTPTSTSPGAVRIRNWRQAKKQTEAGG